MNNMAKPIQKWSSPSRRSYPQVIKYMGSKAGIIDFVVEGISTVHQGGPICDLFAGACSLAGAIGSSPGFISNDIQSYSAVIAHCYLEKASDWLARDLGAEIVERASEVVKEISQGLPGNLEHGEDETLDEFNAVEANNKALINVAFSCSHHLFTRYYSGTWWSAEQCKWIDAIRKSADEHLHSDQLTKADHSLVLTALMHAMAYCSQGTGHYAQYRDANTLSSKIDISIYRKKSLLTLFSKKLASLVEWNRVNVPQGVDFELSSLDYADRLVKLSGGTVYADPPYAFVHYSRFYHAIETLVRYDYPDLQVKGGSVVKGRYREDRHQSPFSIRSQVPKAFETMFTLCKEAGANLVLSYSDTGLYALDEMSRLAIDCLDQEYDLEILFRDHTHMTMGRRLDRDRNVREALLLAKRRNQ